MRSIKEIALELEREGVLLHSENCCMLHAPYLYTSTTADAGPYNKMICNGDDDSYLVADLFENNVISILKRFQNYCRKHELPSHNAIAFYTEA